ncbi:MAG TPA: hypothetical protein VLG16_02185 [Candidatus Saccharimonadales bacterium]|nr:hypothetical protein [Candidatus Saccharimonadales bacterium]
MESQPPFKFSEHSSSWDEDDDSDTSSTPKARPVSPQPGQKEEPLPTRPGFFMEAAKKDDKKEAEPLFRPAEHIERTTQAEKESQPSAKTNGAERLEGEPETLTPEEVTLVMQEYVDGRSEAVDAELEQSKQDSPTAAAAFADKRFLEHFEERLANQLTEAVDAILEGALYDTAQELGLPQNNTEASVESSENTSTSALENVEESPNNTENVLAPAPEATLGQAENNIDNDDSLSSSAPSPMAPTSKPTTSASLAPSNTVPAVSASASRPAAGNSSGAGVPPYGGNVGGTGGNFSPNRAPDAMAATGANVAGRPETLPLPNRSGHDFAKGAMLGGAAGYLIGRRRGRILTERKFTPVTEKLQKEVAELQDKVVQKEQQVRKMTIQKVIAEQPARVAVPKTAEQPAANSEVLTPVATRQPEQALASAQLQQKQEQKQQQEAQPSVKETAAQEQFTQPKRTASAESKLPAPGAIEHMPKIQLLEAAAEVVVAGSTLKKMYEAGVLNETSLRKVMVEYARGGNAQAEHQLRTELAAAQKEQLVNREADALPTPDKRQDAGKPKQLQNEAGIWARDMYVATVEHPHGWQAQAAINEHARQKVVTTPPKQAGRAGPLAAVAAILVAALIVWLFITH